MPKQVLAEEIEQFLGTVEGVASARLLTSASGEIDQIYVTADSGTEGRAARRTVVAALATRFEIPVEPWRVQVAAVKQFAPTELPYLRALRIEETIAATETAGRVQVAWERAGEQRTGTGQARGPTGAHHRLRTLAAAAVEAARAVISPSHRRITVQHVSLTTCMDRPLVLVGITVGGPAGQDAFVGAAFQRDGASDAAVAAALDAVTKFMLRSAFETPEAVTAGDRRAHLEAMRRYARTERAIRPDATGEPAPSPASQATVEPTSSSFEGPGSAPPPSPSAASRSASLREERVADPSPEPPVDAEPHGAEWRPATRSAGPRTASSGGGVGTAVHPDILNDLREIRPEEKRGVAMAAHHENARTGVAPRTGRQAIEDEYFADLIERRTPVHVRCRDGYELSHAVVRDVGTYTLVVEIDGTTELLYKHAIISVRPAGARD